MTFNGLKTCREMINLNVEKKSSEEVIRFLCQEALEKGFIDKIFIDKILEREKSFPTGLATVVPIAIPHVQDGCLESFFSMAVLKEPVEFEAMDGSEEKINVKIVFLFGITDPSQQTKVLMKFSEIFQDSSIMNNFKNSKEIDKLIDLLKENMGDLIILI